MPAGLVEHENGMCLRGQGAGDLVKMMLHRLRVGARHDYGCPPATLGADRTKEIGRFGAQIGECLRSGAAPRPAPCARSSGRAAFRPETRFLPASWDRASP